MKNLRMLMRYGSAFYAANAMLVLVAAPAFAAALGPPRVDIGKTCRASINEIVKLFGNATLVSFESCVKQHNEAFEQMRKDWSAYTTAERSHCIQAQSYMPSYVEWLTCFEMERGVRFAPKNPFLAAQVPHDWD